MNPQSSEQAGQSVPTAMQVQAPAGQPQQQPQSQPAAALALPVMPLPPPPAAPVSTAPQSTDMPVPTTLNTTSAEADDSDIIEIEWINKAKAIIARTKNDPYLQSRELMVFKADYMQKRYNKTIKSGGD